MISSYRHTLYILLCCVSTFLIACSQSSTSVEAQRIEQRQENADTIDFSILSVGHDYVDLGICQGLCWATMNVGAERPEDRGVHFTWGEATINKEPHYGPKDYPFGYPANKYIARNNNGYYHEDWVGVAVDGKTVLESCDDAAHVNWGGGWRMPFADELDSLITLCRWETDTLNGSAGYRVWSTRKGYEDRSIFLPYNGAWSQLSWVKQNTGVYLWSKTLGINPDASIGILASAEYMTRTYYYRYQGQAIRPVFLPHERHVEQVRIDSMNLRLTLGGNAQRLKASTLPEDATRPQLYWHSSDYSVATVDSFGLVSPVGPGWCFIIATATDGTSRSASCRVRVFEDTPPNHPCIDLGICNHLRWATENVGRTTETPRGRLLNWSEASSLLWGQHWRLPTEAELDSLRSKCSWERTVENGISGYKVTGKTRGFEEHSIFLPDIDSSAPLFGIYWSASRTDIHEKAHTAIAFADDDVLWTYRPDSCQLMVRMVYSLE